MQFAPADARIATVQNDPHSAALRYAIARALIPHGKPARTGVWIENLFAECAHADFESFTDFAFECTQMEKVGLLRIQPSEIRKALIAKSKTPGADPRGIYPTQDLIKTMRVAG